MKLDFWNIIAHIVPGFLLTMEILYLLEITIDISVYNYFIIVLMTVPAGLIIDGFHHRFIKHIYDFFISRKLTKSQKDASLKEFYYLPKIGIEIFDRYYKSFYHASEGYTNISTSLIPLLFVLRRGYKLNFFITYIIPILIIVFLYICGYIARYRHKTNFEILVEGVKSIEK